MKWLGAPCAGNGECLQVAFTTTGRIAIRNTGSPRTIVAASRKEFRVFVDAVKDGDYDDLAYDVP